MDPLNTRREAQDKDAQKLDPALASTFSHMKNTIADEATFSAVYKFLLSHVSDPIWICDETGNTLFVNEHFTDLTGFTQEDITSKPSIDFFETRYYPTIQDERRRRKKGLISAYEVQFRTKMGHFIPIKINAYPLPNGSTLGILTDLSEHSVLTDIHRTIIERMDQAAWVANSEDRCIYANPAMCQMLGYTLEEMCTKTSTDIVPDKYKKLIEEETAKHTRGYVSQYDIHLLSNRNEEIPVHVWAAPLPNGGNMAIITDLRNNEKEELAYKYLIENMNEAVWLRSKNGELEFANQHFCELLGYSQDELIGDTEFFYWDKASKPKIYEEHHKRSQGISSVYQAELRTKHGELIPVLVSASPTLHGGSFGIITDLRDIIAKENVYQNLVEHMNEAVWLGDEDEKTIYTNPKFRELTGYTEEECLGETSFQFLDQDSAEMVRKQNKLRERGNASKYEARLKTKSGELIPVLVSGTPIMEGGTIGILTDLRPIKEKEHELAKRDHYLATVTENSADGIISTNLDGEIVSWNQGAEKIFGFTKTEAIGKHYRLYTPAQKIDKGEIDQVNKEIARRGFVKDFRTQRMHKEGHLIDVSLTKSGLQDEQGKYIGYAIIYRDISLQKKWEEELNLRFENLKNAYSELGKKGRHMDYFVDLLDIIVGNFEVNSVADFIIGATAMITKVDACTLRIYNRESNLLMLKATNGVTAEWYNQGNTAFQGSLEEEAFHLRKPTKILDLQQEPRYRSHQLAIKHGLHSILVIPLFIHDEFLGGLKLYISKESKFSLLDNEFIENFSKLASIALKLAKRS